MGYPFKDAIQDLNIINHEGSTYKWTLITKSRQEYSDSVYFNIFDERTISIYVDDLNHYLDFNINDIEYDMALAAEIIPGDKLRFDDDVFEDDAPKYLILKKRENKRIHYVL